MEKKNVNELSKLNLAMCHLFLASITSNVQENKNTRARNLSDFDSWRENFLIAMLTLKALQFFSTISS